MATEQNTPTIQNQPRLLTPENLAASIQFHPESVRRLIRAGAIRAKKFGRSWRIEPDEAERIRENGIPKEVA